jgi:hypothetical protein
LRIDPSRIDWLDLSVDTLGILGDVGLRTGHPVGIGLWAVSEGAELVTAGTPWEDLDTGDPADVLLLVAEGALRGTRLDPYRGWLVNSASIFMNLSSASYMETDPYVLIGSPQWSQPYFSSGP